MPTARWGLSVYALVVDPAGRWLLLRRDAAVARWPGKWSPPGGKVEPGERFDAALRREVREETGLEVELRGVLGAVDAELPGLRVAFLLVEAQALGAAVRLDAEHDEFRWVEPARLRELPLLDPLAPLLLAAAEEAARAAARRGPPEPPPHGQAH